MGTDKVAFVEKRGGATGSGPDRNRKSRKYALRMRNRYILYYYYTSSTVVPLRMTDRATVNNVTPKGSLGCAHAQHEAGGGSALFSGVFTGNDVTRRGPSGERIRNRKLGISPY